MVMPVTKILSIPPETTDHRSRSKIDRTTPYISNTYIVRLNDASTLNRRAQPAARNIPFDRKHVKYEN